MLWKKARRSHNVNDTRQGKEARTSTGIKLGAGLAALALASAGLYSTLDNTPTEHPRVPDEDPQLSFVQSVLGETEDNKAIREPITVKAKPKCTTCGKQNKATAKFCSECGTALVIYA